MTTKTKKEPMQEHLKLTQEQLTERQKNIEKQIEILKKEKTSLGLVKRTRSNKDRQRDAIVGSFFHKKYTENYEKMVKSPEFNKYLNRNKDRELFGFPPLDEQTEDSTKISPEKA